jgi:peptidoglycan/LPS O-acetylase OafA/YrhL
MEFAKKMLAGHIQVNQLNNANNNLFTFFSNLLLLNSVKLPGVTDVSWNIPSWSISAEMVSYLLFGAAVWCIHRCKIYGARNYVYASLAITSLLLMRALTGNFRLTYSFDYGFLRAAIGFFSGAVCFNIFNATRQKMLGCPKWLFSAGEMLAFAAMVLLVYNGGTRLPGGAVVYWLKSYGYLYELLFFCSIYLFAFEGGMVSWLFKKSRFLKNVGTYSYSIYMTHAFCLSLFNILFIRILKFPPTAYWYLAILNYALIYFVSQFTYRQIEIRFQLKKKKPQPAAQTAKA